MLSVLQNLSSICYFNDCPATCISMALRKITEFKYNKFKWAQTVIKQTPNIYSNTISVPNEPV
jgi:hypothetical protein